MATITRFEELEIWQMTRQIAKEINDLIKTNKLMLDDKRFCSQIKASSGSIMDNIAEGFERNGREEFKQFCSIAKASAGETRSQIYRAADDGYITREVEVYFVELLLVISKKIAAFKKVFN
jgi:four helix bundle protein